MSDYYCFQFFETRLRTALYKNADSSGRGDGVLVFSGIDYMSASHVTEYRIEIFKAIATQLYYCPRSLIVFDEVGNHFSMLASCLTPRLSCIKPRIIYFQVLSWLCWVSHSPSMFLYVVCISKL